MDMYLAEKPLIYKQIIQIIQEGTDRWIAGKHWWMAIADKICYKHTRFYDKIYLFFYLLMNA